MATHAMLYAASVGLIVFPAHAIELSWGHIYPVDSVYHQCALQASEKIRAATEGRYDVTVYPEASLGDEDELRRGQQYGNVDIAFLTAQQVSVDFSSLETIIFPYAIQDFGRWLEFKDSKYYQDLKQGYQSATGNNLSSVIYGGQRHLLADRPINSPKQLDGTQIAVQKGIGFSTFPMTMNATPTIIEAQDLPVALKSGTIAGTEATAAQAIEWQAAGGEGVLNLTAHGTNLVLTVVAGSANIEPSDQSSILDTLFAAGVECAEIVRIREIKDLEHLEKAGFVDVKHVDIDDFKRASMHGLTDDQRLRSLKEFQQNE